MFCNSFQFPATISKTITTTPQGVRRKQRRTFGFWFTAQNLDTNHSTLVSKLTSGDFISQLKCTSSIWSNIHQSFTQNAEPDVGMQQNVIADTHKQGNASWTNITLYCYRNPSTRSCEIQYAVLYAFPSQRWITSLLRYHKIHI